MEPTILAVSSFGLLACGLLACVLYAAAYGRLVRARQVLAHARRLHRRAQRLRDYRLRQQRPDPGHSATVCHLPKCPDCGGSGATHDDRCRNCGANLIPF